MAIAKCEVCGKSFSHRWKTRKTCSQKCRVALHVQQMRSYAGRADECPQCGCRFIRRCVSQKYCSNDCRGDADSKREASKRVDPTPAEIAAMAARMKAIVLYPEKEQQPVNRYRQVMETAKRVAGADW